MARWDKQLANDPGFWQKCLDHKVFPFRQDSQYDVRHTHSEGNVRGFVKLIDTSQGVAPASSRFVLMPDRLPAQIVQQLVPVFQDKRLSSGYLINDALDYETIYLIDPNHHFSESERMVFVDNDRTLIMISGSTPTELVQDLEAKLS